METCLSEVREKPHILPHTPSLALNLAVVLLKTRTPAGFREPPRHALNSKHALVIEGLEGGVGASKRELKQRVHSPVWAGAANPGVRCGNLQGYIFTGDLGTATPLQWWAVVAVVVLVVLVARAGEELTLSGSGLDTQAYPIPR
ncbi:hypothetical protein O3P69_002425 [Scylla paramamosain]|uniref:Uncharacterized protein n=1 Tax=Scylla paramamosain TaxID=85552 RepID=A0AAW0V8M9_SCYPA